MLAYVAAVCLLWVFVGEDLYKGWLSERQALREHKLILARIDAQAAIVKALPPSTDTQAVPQDLIDAWREVNEITSD